jgi:hypothetical protein
MGSQNVSVKGMGAPPTIPTQVATGAMAELVSDPRLFVGITKNKQRNERLVFVLTFFTGTFVETGHLLFSRCLNHFNDPSSIPRRSHWRPSIQIFLPSTMSLIDGHFQAVCGFVHLGCT